MSATVGPTGLLRFSGFLRFSKWDGVLVGLSFAYGAALLLAPSIPLVAIGLWWTSNTVAHNFIHTPFFRSARLNTAYSLFLSALTGIPQTLWRRRHLDHHAGRALPARQERPPRDGDRCGGRAVGLAGACRQRCVLRDRTCPAMPPASGCASSRDTTSTPAARPVTTAGLYNLCFFNDGYHVEHHARPGVHWTRLPRLGAASRASQPLAAGPALARRIFARGARASGPDGRRGCNASSSRATNARSGAAARAAAAASRQVTIVGGGLFPRTLLILRQLLPEASLTIVEQRAEHIAAAQAFLQRRSAADDGAVRFAERTFDPATEAPAELLVIPLAYDRRSPGLVPGAAGALHPDSRLDVEPAPGRVPISWLLLKRLNLVTR